MNELQFATWWAVFFLPLPWLVYRFIPAASNTGAALKVPFYDAVHQMQGRSRLRGGKGRSIWMTLCWLLLIIAAMRPQLIGQNHDVPVSGRDLMMAVDVSGSMKARDMYFQGQQQDRLTAVKRVAGEFIRQRVGDRIGLILFGTRAYLQAPLSLDRETVNLLLQESAIGIAGEKTAIGDAIGLGLKRLKDRPGSDRVMILLTDGANTAGVTHPVEAARLASVAGLRIYTIGVGAGPVGFQGGISSFLRASGHLDEEVLKAIAEQTGGRYFLATDANSLESIYRLIDQLEPVAEEESNLRPVKELFYWPLACVLILTMLWAARSALSGISLAGRSAARDAAVEVQHVG